MNVHDPLGAAATLASLLSKLVSLAKLALAWITPTARGVVVQAPDPAWQVVAVRVGADGEASSPAAKQSQSAAAAKHGRSDSGPFERGFGYDTFPPDAANVN
jgi:hypothetical protein